jgi:hypothetical protein
VSSTFTIKEFNIEAKTHSTVTLGGNHRRLKHHRQTFGSLFSPREALRRTFLPRGFPDSVPKEFLPYQSYKFVQDVTTMLLYSLSTQELLSGFGIGREAAAGVSAITSWLLRDGAGMVGSLFFTEMVSDEIGQDPRRWHLFGDVAYDLGYLLDLIAGAFFGCHRPVPFLGLLCVGSICKAIACVAQESANSAISLHFSRQGADIGEIVAKTGSVSPSKDLCFLRGSVTLGYGSWPCCF